MEKLISIIMLVVVMHFTTSAQNTCNGVWGQLLINQTFGQGTPANAWYGPLNTYAPGATTSTTFVGTAGPVGGTLSDGFSGLAKIPSASGQGNWVSTPDHTGNTNGLMFLINAPSTAATVFFEYTMDNLCPNTTLKLSVWILNVNDFSLTANPTYQYPNMTLRAIDAATNTVLGTAESGNVAADAAWHQYSVIFNNGATTSVKLQLVNNSVGSGFGNDLAIDDITIQPCVPESHILPKLDVTICQNTVMDFNAQVINSPYNPAEYQWQYSTDGGTTWLDQGAAGSSTTYTFDPATLGPGTYLVRYKTGPQGTTANNNCVAVSDTSIIEVLSFPQITLNEAVCLGNTYNFYGRELGLSGTYDTLVRSSPADVCGTQVTLHLTAKPMPDVTIAGDAARDLCTGDTLILKAANPKAGTTYQWLNERTPIAGETGDQYYTYRDGSYYLAGQLNGCVDTSARVKITERPLPAAVIQNDNPSVCASDTLNFEALNADAGCLYQWYPAKAFRMVSGDEGLRVRGTFEENTVVTLNVYSAYGCHTSDTTVAFVHPCCEVFVPTAFSPNNDGLNDYFNPALQPGQIIIGLKIFDRYGKMVYNNSNYKKGWDGHYTNGESAACGVYMYHVQYTCSDRKTYEKKGDLTLVR